MDTKNQSFTDAEAKYKALVGLDSLNTFDQSVFRHGLKSAFRKAYESYPWPEFCHFGEEVTLNVTKQIRIFNKNNDPFIPSSNRERYGYNIDSVLNSDNVLFNTYLKDNFYDWHKDASNNYYHDIKFTILINNSTENYYGGDFQIFTSGGEHTISNFNKTGTVLMFKSDIPHRVLPVNKGKRNSIAFFIRGSKFI